MRPVKTIHPGAYLRALILVWSISFLSGCTSGHKDPATIAPQTAWIGQNNLTNSTPAQFSDTGAGDSDFVPSYYDPSYGPAGEGRHGLRHW